LLGATAARGSMDGNVSHLDIATTFETMVKARVPENKHIEIRPIANKQYKTPT
jgi:hypothetical protein